MTSASSRLPLASKPNSTLRSTSVPPSSCQAFSSTRKAWRATRRISGNIFDSSARLNTSDTGSTRNGSCPCSGLAGLNSLICLPSSVNCMNGIVGDQRLALPVLVLGLEVELDQRMRKQLALGKVRISLQIRAVRFAPHHHLIGQHAAIGRDERGLAVLLDEGDRQAAGFEQAEHIGRGRGGDAALVRDDVVLGAVAGRDVVLGDHGDQIGAAFDLVDFFGLALGDEGAERMLRGHLYVHGRGSQFTAVSLETTRFTPNFAGCRGQI